MAACSPLDPTCWRYQKLNRPCPITGEEQCKCKYVIESPLDVDLKDKLRKLFSDHAVWTHSYIVAEVFATPNLAPVTDRLLQNQRDIGAAIASIYGQEFGDHITELLEEHILLASTVVKSAITKAKNITSSLEADVEGLFENSAKVAKALSMINREALPYKTVLSHFDEHNQYVINLAQMYIEGKYQAVIEEYDCYYNHMLLFSDLLTYGIESPQ